MKIDHCSFGSIVIDSKHFSSDLVIFPDGHIEDGWRREKGHRLSSHDIADLIRSKPEAIVAGTGVSGQVKPETSLLTNLKQKGIEFFAAPNPKAMELYNEMSSGDKRVGACFHLTC